MSVSLAQIGFSIRNQAKGYFSSDDERIDIELIYKMVHQIRSSLIKERYEEGLYLDATFYQEICCLEVKCRNTVCNGIESGEVEYYVEGPAIEDLGGPEIMFFGTLATADQPRQEFSQTNYMGMLYADHSPWTGGKTRYMIVGNEIKIKNIPTSGLKYVCLIAILSDPMNGKCFTQSENDPYPIPNNLVHKLELIALKQLMSTLQNPPDQKNNAQENPRFDNQIKS